MAEITYCNTFGCSRFPSLIVFLFFCFLFFVFEKGGSLGAGLESGLGRRERERGRVCVKGR